MPSFRLLAPALLVFALCGAPQAASAQAGFLRGDNKTARELASRAKTRFAVGTPGWVKADDIVSAKPMPGQKSN